MQLIRTATSGLLAGAALFALASGVEAGASPVEGTWMTVSKTEMTIAPCPEGFCGFISKIVVPEEYVAKYGKDIAALNGNFTDSKNKDPNLRSRPIQGLQILTLKPGSNPFYFDGEIYNPEDGNTYAGSVEVLDADSLKLKGCVLLVLCQDQQWQRVPTPPEPPAE